MVERRGTMNEKIPEFYALYTPETAEARAEVVSEVERLMDEFAAHESQEGEFTKRYKEIAEKSHNPLIKFLLQLIISDEEKHNALTHAMVSTLKGGLTWSRPEGAIRGFSDLAEEKEEIMRLTEGFIRLEKDGIKEYKKLIKTCKSYYHGVFVLLLQSMIRDSEKHVEILEFLHEKLRKA
jgi:bacterioferritin (cytochrome b1)